MEKDAIKHKLIAIGGSAGSLDIILKIVASASVNTAMIYVIILHRKPDAESILENLFSFCTKLVVREVEDKDTIKPGHIYIAPADYHLLLEDKKNFSLDSSEKVFFSRPSIDVTFESIAEVYGSLAIGILLSGANADGAKGLSSIKKSGGFTIVQNPKSAEVDYMPRQAIEQLQPDAIVDADEIPSFLNKLIAN